jgi:hypothetical protein
LAFCFGYTGVVFGNGDDGSSSAMKNWAPNKNEGSALIANIALHHPTWGIFEL